MTRSTLFLNAGDCPAGEDLYPIADLIAEKRKSVHRLLRYAADYRTLSVDQHRYLYPFRSPSQACADCLHDVARKRRYLARLLAAQRMGYHYATGRWRGHLGEEPPSLPEVQLQHV